MPYRVDIGSAARRTMKHLPATVAQRIDDAIRRLGQAPRPTGCEKLTGYAHTYRIRVGGYRIIYRIHDDILVVLVIRIGHRREIYRDL